MKKKPSILFILVFLLMTGPGYAQTVAAPAAPIKTVQGWYFNVLTPSGMKIVIGPYPTDAEAADTFGSVLYSHPFACHTDPSKQNCRITGNGFGFPASTPYPVPKTAPNYPMLATGPYKAASTLAVKSGWYFLFYTATGGLLEKCSLLAADQKLVKTVPADSIGYYKNKACPGAPCFSVGFDTACN